MRFFFIGIIFLLYLCVASAQSSITLSSKTEISILTCYPGNVSWQAYGHSAIRVKDETQNLDIVFNYGTFDFSDPNFLVKFVRGKLPYMLSVDPFQVFLEEYQDENRSVLEQTLQLSAVEKQKQFDFLVWNAKKENREYYYDFVYNNCCTKIRDLFSSQLANQKIFKDEPKLTIRQILDGYNNYNEWQDLGIDLLLGSRLDKIPTTAEKMFLPIDLQNAFDRTPNLVEKENTLFEAVITPAYIVRPKPGFVFWLLFIVLLIYAIRKKNGTPYGKTGPFLVLFITGLLGAILCFMWFGTDHLCTKMNYNIVWAMPLNIIACWFVFSRSFPKIISYYLRFYRIILILILIFWTVLPQEFHKSLIPIILLIIHIISTILPLQNEKTIR